MFLPSQSIFKSVILVCLRSALLLCLLPLSVGAGESGLWRPELGLPLSHQVGQGDVNPDRYLWNAYESADGVLYFAQDRLLRFDGDNWTALGPDSLQILRGVAEDADGNLWVAAYNEIGYFPAGEWYSGEFVSIRSHLPERWRDFGESWDLKHLNGDIWMATTDRLYRWDGESFQVWTMPADDRVIYHFSEDGIYYHITGEGLFQFDEGGSRLLLDDPDLVRPSLIHWEQVAPDRFLGLSGNGFFEWLPDEDRLVNHRCAVLSDAIASSVHRLGDGRLVVATLLDGLLIYNPDFSLAFRFNEDLGAPSNLVTGLFPDSDGGVWVFFSGALVRLDFGRASGYLSAEQHLPPGILRQAGLWDSGFVVATDQGLFQQNDPILSFERMSPHSMRNDFVPPKSSEQAFLVSAEYGTVYYWRGNELQDGHDSGAYIRRMLASKFFPGRYWLLHNQAFSIADWSNGQSWDNPVSLQGLPIAAEYMTEDIAGRVWFSAPGSALVRVEPGISGANWEHQVYRELPSVSLDDRNWLMIPLGGSVAVVSQHALVAFDDEVGWTPVSVPNAALLPAPPRLSVQLRDGSVLLLCRDEETDLSYLVELRLGVDGRPQTRRRHHPGLEWVGVVRGMGLSSDAQSSRLLHLWGARGLLTMDLDAQGDRLPPRQPVLLEWMVDGQPVRKGESGHRRIDFDYTEMQVAFASPGFDSARPHRYQIRVGGDDAQWSTLSYQTRRDIGRLLEGDYRLEIRAQDANGLLSEPLRLSFQILPPWYRTFWAYGSYMLGMGIGVWILVYYRERKLRERKHMLEELVAQRTLELEKASRIKSDFIANMSHEIRNPLNGVIGLIGRLRPNEAVPERHQLALRRAAQYLQTTVEEVLDFSRIESGHIELNVEAFDPESILEGVIEIYSERAVSKKLKLTFSPRNPDGWQVVSDASKVQQIAGNLVGNAVKFTDSGSVHLGLAVDAVADGRGWLKFWVQDTGPGIPADEQDKVFGKYYQIQNETGDAHRVGTGLGLSLCRDFVERLGGSMQVFSEYGEGSTFTVTLPVELKQPASLGTIENTEAELLPLRVLVVEDLEYNRLFLEDWLREQGCRVTTCLDGESGYAEALRESYDLIFLDWDLPRLSGLEVAQRLRSGEPAVRHARIVGMTAFATMETRKACLDAGMDAFITKPISEERLLAVLREASVSVSATLEIGVDPVQDSLDWEILERTSKARKVSLASEFERFLELLDDQLLELERVLKQGDMDAGRHLIHAVLGHAGLIRCQGFNEAVKDLQVAFLAADTAGVESEWQCVQAERRKFDERLVELKEGSSTL